MDTVCKIDACAGCMACVDICPVDAIQIKDEIKSYNAEIDMDKCIHCNLCKNVCQHNQVPEKIRPIGWKQGWADDKTVRQKSASGGVCSSIMRTFAKNGGVVFACYYFQGAFCYGKAESVSEIAKFAGSKYVKSNPSGIYKKVKECLKKGHKALFIGLPCQVAACKNYIGESNSKNLYTIDLICHGTPSPELLEKFLNAHHTSLKQVCNIAFRSKNCFTIDTNRRYLSPRGTCDRFTLGFLRALFYTENCYSCTYAGIERISDITLGDSWGSELSKEDSQKGISLVLWQTEKGEELLKMSDLYLVDVDIETAISNNGQLKQPSIPHKSREKFFARIAKGTSLNKAVFRSMPYLCIKQSIKAVLVKTHLINGSGYGVSIE
mgnify:CR=1 FL=1